MATFNPEILPKCSRMVSMSSRACEGCSFMPSPALMTCALTVFAKRRAAPDAGWRMTITSFCMASNVFPVSTSVSPFCTEEAATEMFTTCAPKNLPASSKEQRVRVEFS